MRNFFLSLVAVATIVCAPGWTSAQEAESEPTPEVTTYNQTLPATPTDAFARGRVISILESGSTDLSGRALPFQIVKVKIETGPQAGQEVVVNHGSDYTIHTRQTVAENEQVVLLQQTQPDGQVLSAIIDSYRLPSLWWLLGLFLLVAVVIAHKKGFLPILGLLVSIALLLKVIIPLIVAGYNAFWVGTLGGAVIIAASLLIGHGRERRTKVALVSTLISVAVAAVTAQIMVSAAHLIGLGSDEVNLFQFGGLADIDTRGLLLAAIVIGTLGVLDDVTTAQTAAVEEIHAANPQLSQAELYRRGLSVGREHIASLINTLVLAYAGAAFPLLLILVESPNQPFWVTMNSEFIAEEIVRTLAGGLTLILAVPIATLVAAWQFAKKVE